MDSLRLLFIVPSKSSSGTNSSLSGIFNSFKDKHHIEVLTLTDVGTGEYEFLKSAFQIPFVNAYFGNFKNLSFTTKLLSVLVKIIKHLSIWTKRNIEGLFFERSIHHFEKQHNYDLVVGFQEGACSQIAHFFSARKVAWIHSDIERASKPSQKEHLMYSSFEKIICVSEYTSEKFCSRYPDLRDKVQSINNIVDVERIKTLSTLPIDDDRFVADKFTIISAGRMDPVKQFTRIPEIARKLVNEGCPFRWYILGGPENAEFEKVKQAINEYSVESHVSLLGNKPNPYPYFASSDLYVSTSYSEACPMVFKEAGLLGVPIVTSNFGSSYEFVKDGVNGYIENIDDLWKPIAEMMNNKQAYQKIKSIYSGYTTGNDFILEQLKKLFV